MATKHCVIHFSSVKDEELKHITDVSRERILEYSSMWQKLDGEAKEIAERINLCDESAFHPGCYRRFTDKTKVAAAETRLRRQSKSNDFQDSNVRKRRSQTNVSKIIAPKKLLQDCNAMDVTLPCENIVASEKSSATVFGDVCLLCQSVRYTTDAVTKVRKPEKLILCQTFNAAKAILSQAEKRHDEKVLLLIKDEDLIAKEARYHSSCYRRYMRCQAKSDKGIVSKAYERFCKEVVIPNIIEAGEVFDMNRLCSLFISIVKEDSGESTFTCSNRTIKAKLKRTFPNLIFTRLNNVRWSELVFVPDTANHVVTDESSEDEADDNEPIKMYESLPDSGQDISRQIFHCANMLRIMTESAPGMSCKWPPLSADLTIEAAEKLIPYHLFNFMAILMGYSHDIPNNTEFLTVSDEHKKKLTSVCQDIIYMMSKGRKQMPKQLALAMTVRHLTGSMKLVGILNGFGHSVSKESVLDFDSALAHYRLEQNTIIPPGFQKIFTTLVFDNNDFGEETLSGKGTTHCTNGIIVQRRLHQNKDFPENTAQNEERVFLPKGLRKQLPVKTKQNSFLMLSKRHGPSTNFCTDVEETTLEKNIFQHSAYLDTLFILTKLQPFDCGHFQLPGWTGFNTVVHSNNALVPEKSDIGYLPVIDGSPTRLEVVNEILQRSVHIADQLEQDSVVVVMDQAIYCKAQQIRWQNPEFERRLVLRLGEFHTALTYLGTIGKRFQDAGLRDLLIDSGLVAEGSINGVLSGRMYNRSIRAIKLFFEGLHRLLMTAFIESLEVHEQQKLRSTAEILLHSYRGNETMTFLEAAAQPDCKEFLSKDKEKRKFAVEEGDHITLVNVFNAFVKNGKNSRWCGDHCLNYKGLLRAVEIREQLKKLLQGFKVPLLSCEGDVDKLRRCITTGFFANAARLHHSSCYRTVRDSHELFLHPTSVLSTQQMPEWLVFNEVLHTNKEYMRDVTTIKPEWLCELAPHFYQFGTERELAVKRRRVE